ncbi:MAG: DNA gyrase subunit B [Kiritimatiellia bacterium]|jgi:DNA gyrase subunit B
MDDTEALAPMEYGASQIQVLEGMEAVRKRPAMYIGDTFERGFHHCVYEVVDNAIDEAMAGYCTHVEVTLNLDGSCTVKDDGRGIPVDMHPTEKRPAVEVVLTVLHAGGKFGGGGYKVSGGLHGVGVSCVNALSEWLEVEVKRDGKVHRVRFSRGHVTKPLEVVGECPAGETGTTVTFRPDKEIFHDANGNSFDFDWDTLSKRFKELAFLNPGVEIRFNDENTKKHAVYLQKDGIVGYIRSLTKHKMSIEQAKDGTRLPCPNAEVISMQGVESGVTVEVAMQYCAEDFDEHIYTFANNINTHEGGTHLVGFCTALTSVVNDYARAMQRDKAKGKGRGAAKAEEFESIDGRDIRQGLYCVVSVKVPDPQFEGQTKTKLGNNNVRGIVQKVVGAKLKDCFEENPSLKNAIVEKALVAQQVRIKIKEFTDRTRKEEGKLGKFLGKLRDCSSRNRDECELFLVEGDSAGGSATQGRDRRTQAILPLRGKVLNVQKASIDRMMANQEIHSLISAIGGGYGNQPPEEGGFDVGKIRYDKVVIMTDADVDGAHIRTLLLTFFYRQMRALISHGHVYLAQPPLYGLKKGKNIEYIESDAKLTSRLISLGAEDFSFAGADGSAKVEPRQMPDLTRTLAAAESLCKRLAKQNVDIRRYFDARTGAGEFPRFRVIVDTDGNPVEHYVFRMDEVKALQAETAALLECELEALDEDDNPNFHCTEILQSKTLRTQMDNLAELYGFRRGDFLGREGETIGTLADKAGKETPVESLLEVLESVRARGRKGFVIQRYKGLGEMDKEQLFETTMDPANRKLLQVTLDDTVEADRVFQLLMGDEVAPRRRWIEENSLMAEIDA